MRLGAIFGFTGFIGTGVPVGRILIPLSRDANLGRWLSREIC